MAVAKAEGAVAQLGGIAGLIGIITGGIGALTISLGACCTGAGTDLIESTVVFKKYKWKYLSGYKQAVEDLKQSWGHVEELCNKI